MAFSKSSAGQKRFEVVERKAKELADAKGMKEKDALMREKFEKDRKASEMKVLLTTQLNSNRDIATAMDSDWQMIDAEAVEESPRERESVKLVFEKSFLKFNEIFQHYCGVATASSISLMEFLHIMDDFQLSEGDDTTEMYLQLWETVHLKWMDNSAVPNNALTRALFLEIFLRLAVNKFKTSQVSTSAALENLIQDFVDPGLDRLRNGDEARAAMRLHDVSLIFRKFHTFLSRVFVTFSASNSDQSQFQNRNTLNMEEFKAMMFAASILEKEEQEEIAKAAFHPDPNRGKRELIYVEFCEALIRVALAVNVDTKVNKEDKVKEVVLSLKKLAMSSN
jgi:hypothetical protein